MLDGYYEKGIFYSSSESRAEGIENNNKNAVTGGILRLLSWFMFLRFAFPQKNFAHKMHKVF